MRMYSAEECGDYLSKNSINDSYPDVTMNSDLPLAIPLGR